MALLSAAEEMKTRPLSNDHPTIGEANHTVTIETGEMTIGVVAGAILLHLAGKMIRSRRLSIGMVAAPDIPRGLEKIEGEVAIKGRVAIIVAADGARVTHPVIMKRGGKTREEGRGAILIRIVKEGMVEDGGTQKITGDGEWLKR